MVDWRGHPGQRTCTSGMTAKASQSGHVPMASSAVELQTEWRPRCSATGSARCVAHGRHLAGHRDFGVTHRRRVLAVHAGRVWAALRAVRPVEAMKPIDPSGGTFSQGLAEGLAARLLRTGFIEARRDPSVGSPAVVEASEVLEIPAPLDDGLVSREHADEPERIHSREW